MELRQRSRSAISGENAGIADPVKKSTSTKQAKTKGIISGQTLSHNVSAILRICTQKLLNKRVHHWKPRSLQTGSDFSKGLSHETDGSWYSLATVLISTLARTHRKKLIT
jgi:hypothetical protein